MRAETRRFGPLACVALGAAAMLFPGGAARAQLPSSTMPTPLDTVFGGGLHAYYTGDFERVLRDLGDVIAAADSPAAIDPRWYYFRGLAALRLGRIEEAEADFTAGAEREAAGLGNWPVSLSLERVQGAERLQLERHRARARVAIMRRTNESQRRRRVAIEEAQPEMQRGRRPLPDLGDGEANPFGSSEPPPDAEPLPTPPEEPAAPAPDAAPAEPAAERPDAADSLELPGDRPLEPQREDSSDPFGDAVDRAPAASEDRAAQQDEQAEALGAEADSTADQVDERTELEAAADEGAAAQRDGQMEAEAPAE